ncbi:hypothetical protein [Chromobacterium rhizoryzae]|nr:hypothetical protein [Chromobacterium rhizoryzae]
MLEVTKGSSGSNRYPASLFNTVCPDEYASVHSKRIASCYSARKHFCQEKTSKMLVPVDSNLLSNGGMENKDIRRANLGRLINEYGTIRALADVVDTAPNYISEIKNGVRDMGHKLARKIEERTGKQSGWLDQLQEDDMSSDDVIVASSIDELAEKIGELETEKLHSLIAKALELHGRKKAT